jgi:SAM-dependent MidA family methyltransferase
MAEEPEQSIRRAIAERGPISFAEFMELALYGPGGFYEEPPVGERGHFVTSPHVHPLFGRLLGGAVRECWAQAGVEDPMTLVEVGAGDGTLLGQLREELEAVPLRYVAVERSPGARRALRRLEPPVRVAASLEELDQHIDGVIVANELLDNLPFRWIRRDDRGSLLEVMVGVDDDRLVRVERPAFSNEDHDLERVAVNLPPGDAATVQEGALHFVERLARVLHHGYAILIDYAGVPGTEIHGYRSHWVVEDVIERPGSADVTAGVDFGVLEERANALGLRSFMPVTQRSALLALGYEGWANEERTRQAEAQDRRSGREAVETWSGRNAAAQLVDQRGMGRFRWWVVASPDMPEPNWLGQAAMRDVEDGFAWAGEGGTRGVQYLTFTNYAYRWWQRPRFVWRFAVRHGLPIGVMRQVGGSGELAVDVADHEEDAPHDGDEVR